MEDRMSDQAKEIPELDVLLRRVQEWDIRNPRYQSKKEIYYEEQLLNFDPFFGATPPIGATVSLKFAKGVLGEDTEAEITGAEVEDVQYEIGYGTTTPEDGSLFTTRIYLEGGNVEVRRGDQRRKSYVLHDPEDDE